MKPSGYIVLAAMLICSACAGQTTISQSQPLVTASVTQPPIRWEEVTAAQTMVRPSNSYLIMMR